NEEQIAAPSTTLLGFFLEENKELRNLLRNKRKRPALTWRVGFGFMTSVDHLVGGLAPHSLSCQLLPTSLGKDATRHTQQATDGASLLGIEKALLHEAGHELIPPRLEALEATLALGGLARQEKEHPRATTNVLPEPGIANRDDFLWIP
ncbi:MAG: hypothetical protein KBD27_03040, partial [Candidatus Moranbacteria bacterium]|nr:hypothetical protein [Candidatus Moranbacteria bacterium]